MCSILLTDKEINKVWDDCGSCTWGEYAKALAKAQIKKVVEWLRENYSEDIVAWEEIEQTLLKEANGED